MTKKPIIDSDKDAIIKKLKSECSYCKNIIDDLENNNSKFENETIKIKKYFEKLKKSSINIR